MKTLAGIKSENDMQDYSYISNADADYIDEMYKLYSEDPEQVEIGWRHFFEGFDFFTEASANGHAASTEGLTNAKELSVISIIYGYRDRGHLLSTTNPIKTRKNRKPHLELSDYNLSEDDLNTRFKVGEAIGLKNATLKEIIDRLNAIYTRNIGFQYNHIEDREKRMWLREKIEGRPLQDDFALSIDEKQRILKKLNDASVFEQFLHTKYIGQKRFSLEGGESTIPALDYIIKEGARGGTQEFVIGMAHRGRLNVLANIMGKTYEQIFSEFEGTAVPEQAYGSGDVKYHLGYSSQIKVDDKKVDLKLVPNPSHLEAVDSVVEGFARAKADILFDSEYDRILPILIHGDAAIAGQGVAYENIQMSGLKGYYTGGTIHYVINNQIGFTTNFTDARTSTYSTAAAQMIQAPVFHVNGDDPEAVVFAAKLALEYRQKFNSDVFIDMVCYRKYGHNEGDDPKFTQPEMYKIIKKHPSPREIYKDILVKRGDVQAKMAEKFEESFWATLQDRFDMAHQERLPYEYQEPELAWKRLTATKDKKDFLQSPVTGIKEKDFKKIIKHLMTLPEGFNFVSKMKRLLKNKQELIDNDTYDWGFAELAAYGSLLLEGHDVRMSGQDCKRGTFAHRHAVLQDTETDAEYNRLSGIDENQGEFRIFNSPLNEFAVLGFEYGYSMASPDTLVLWEAQFGDFANGAQTIMDQFVTASEAKWQRMSGLTILLPHGYEGQGPEHSSGRMERTLQMCAEYNVAVVNITKPANYFHVLRRQLHRPFRKPLFVFSPKSLLRHPLCVSPEKDFLGENFFHETYDDPDFSTARAAGKVKRLLLCSGKVYYDLLEARNKAKLKDVAIARVEQLYPLPDEQIKAIVKRYKKADVFWVQEEPANMGPNWFIKVHLNGLDFETISRPASASPATGFHNIHEEQQKDVIERALGIA